MVTEMLQRKATRHGVAFLMPKNKNYRIMNKITS